MRSALRPPRPQWPGGICTYLSRAVKVGCGRKERLNSNSNMRSMSSCHHVIMSYCSSVTSVGYRPHISLCNWRPYQAATGTWSPYASTLSFFTLFHATLHYSYACSTTLFSPGIFNTADHSLVGTLLVFKSLFS
jgi:hypothetical protein